MPFTKDEEDSIDEAVASKQAQINSLQMEIARLQAMLDPLLASVAKLEGLKTKISDERRK